MHVNHMRPIFWARNFYVNNLVLFSFYFHLGRTQCSLFANLKIHNINLLFNVFVIQKERFT